jgi:hypothetical protein
MNSHLKEFSSAMTGFFFLSIMLFMLSCSPPKNKEDDIPRQQKQLSELTVLPKGKMVVEDDRPTGNTKTDIPYGTKDPKQQGNNQAGQQSKQDIYKKKYKNLLVFHVDDSMEVAKSKMATLVLSKNENIENVKLEVLEKSGTVSDKLEIDTSMEFGTKMKAKLAEFNYNPVDKCFEIEPLGEDVQTFRQERKKILWQWKVTPLKSGQHELRLTVQIIEKDGEAVTLPARSYPVIIYTKPSSFFTRVGDFLARKYEWVITAILLPVMIAWFTTRMRNRSARANKGNISH